MLDWLRKEVRSLRWTYVLGWLFIVLIAVTWELFAPALREARALVDRLVPSASLGWRVITVAAALVLVPLAAGRAADFLLRAFRGRRDVETVRRLQDRLFAEVEPGDSRGYRVAMVAWPNPTVRTLALVTATFSDADGGELAALYLPGTPDPAKGALKVGPVDDLTFIDWTVEDLWDFHATFGSASPEST
jgi:uncharacterized membrane protein